jgi:hypothetical protein
MKKTKNNHYQKNDKTNSQNKKQFRNKGLISDNTEIEATNEEIIEEIDTNKEKCKKIIEIKKLKDRMADQSEDESENNSDENVEEEGEDDENNNEEISISRESFNIKLFMIVNKLN